VFNVVSAEEVPVRVQVSSLLHNELKSLQIQRSVNAVHVLLSRSSCGAADARGW
jgi:hypothetical protein